jgi:hypothetical protein
VPLHLPDGDRAELLVREQVEQPDVFLGDHRGELGGRLGAGDGVEPALFAALVGTGDDRFLDDAAAAAFLAAGALELVISFPRGDEDEQVPEVVAVGKPGIPPLHGARAEALEGAEGGVFLVLNDPQAARRAKLGPGDTNQTLEVALPQGLGRSRVPSLQRVDPARDRSPPLGVVVDHLRPLLSKDSRAIRDRTWKRIVMLNGRRSKDFHRARGRNPRQARERPGPRDRSRESGFYGCRSAGVSRDLATIRSPSYRPVW